VSYNCGPEILRQGLPIPGEIRGYAGKVLKVFAKGAESMGHGAGRRLKILDCRLETGKPVLPVYRIEQNDMLK